jgi:hypothetical protein
MRRSLLGSFFVLHTVLALGAVIPLSACAIVETNPLDPGSAARGPNADLSDFVTQMASVDASNNGSGSDAADAAVVVTASGCDVHKVRVNELATGGAGGATDEFIELYNPCTSTASLSGGKLVYRAATATTDNYTLYAFTSQTIVAHGYFVVAGAGFTGSADLKPYQSGSGLAATGGGVALKDATDAVVDSVGWGTATNAFVEGHVAAAPSTSQSLARTTDGTDTNDNAADFELIAPTPGVAN